MPVVARDDYAALRSFCERTGAPMPDITGHAGQWGRDLMAVCNMLAYHLEALEGTLNAHLSAEREAADAA